METGLEGTFVALRALHALDQRILQAEAELHRVPAEIAADRALQDEQGAQAKRIEADLRATIDAQRAAERDLADLEARRDRAQRRLAQLTSAAQIDATDREILDLGRQIELGMTVVLERMEEAEARMSRLDELSALRERGRLATDEVEARWSRRSPDVEAMLAELRPRRAEVAARVVGEPMRLYTLALTDRRFLPGGITVIEGGTCHTCHQRPPPLWVQEVRSHKAVHACQGCRRVMVVDSP
jgi:predicted  nucleic acid-binding Zn-ribbon protein